MKTLAAAFAIHRQMLGRRFADAVFVVLLMVIVIVGGWLVARHDHYWDWTARRDNSLHPETLRILERVDGPLRVTVFAAPGSALGKTIARFFARYAQALPTLELQLRDPQLFPEQARDADVTLLGQALLEYRGRRETLNEIGERAVSGAVLRLTEARRPWLAVVEGHGERAITGAAPGDLGRFGQELLDQGYLARPLDLTVTRAVPDNTGLVVLSHPSIALFPDEGSALRRYLDRGGNLLWLLEPEDLASDDLNALAPLLDVLGIKPLPGTVVDAGAARLGMETPAVAVIDSFPDDALTQGLNEAALLPGSAAFDTTLAPGWMLATYLATGEQSWNETGAVAGTISRDEVIGERAGPLPVILALTRQIPETGGEQRVVVAGDGDFLSNAHVANHGNRALGVRLIRWLSGSEPQLALPPPLQVAQPLDLDPVRRGVIGFGMLILLPALILGLGLLVRWQRGRET